MEPIAQPGQKQGGLGGRAQIFSPGDGEQTVADGGGGDPAEIIPLAPGQDGGQAPCAVSVVARINIRMGRRLLQDFQQCVKGGGGQHVHLVHDVDPLFDRRRGVDRLIPEGPHLVHPVVGGGVQLQHVQDRAVFDGPDRLGSALQGLPSTGCSGS